MYPLQFRFKSSFHSLTEEILTGFLVTIPHLQFAVVAMQLYNMQMVLADVNHKSNLKVKSKANISLWRSKNWWIYWRNEHPFSLCQSPTGNWLQGGFVDRRPTIGFWFFNKPFGVLLWDMWTPARSIGIWSRCVVAEQRSEEISLDQAVLCWMGFLRSCLLMASRFAHDGLRWPAAVWRFPYCPGRKSAESYRKCAFS